MIEVTGANDVTGMPSVVEFTNHTPLTYESYKGGLGRPRRLIFVGDVQPVDCQLVVPDNSFAVREVIFLKPHKEASAGLRGPDAFRPGLPILGLGPDARFDAGRPPALELKDIPVSVYLDRSKTEIQLGDAAEYDRGLTHGRVTFLVGKDHLVGIRISDLSAEEHDIMGYHLGHHR